MVFHYKCSLSSHRGLVGLQNILLPLSVTVLDPGNHYSDLCHQRLALPIVELHILYWTLCCEHLGMTAHVSFYFNSVTLCRNSTICLLKNEHLKVSGLNFYWKLKRGEGSKLAQWVKGACVMSHKLNVWVPSPESNKGEKTETIPLSCPLTSTHAHTTIIIIF